MANWHYINKDGEKITVTSKELKQLALQGTITPETIVETEDGKAAPAKKVKGLTFAGTTQPEKKPSAETYSLAEKNVQKSTENYFYTNENGIKSGQINKQRLQTLIDRGIFTSSTLLETNMGHQIFAGEIPELNFNNVALPPVAPLSTEPNSSITPTKRSKKRMFAYGCYGCLAFYAFCFLIGAINLIIFGPPDPVNTQTERALTPEEEREKKKREGWDKLDRALQREHERQLQREQQLINSYGSELNR